MAFSIPRNRLAIVALLLGAFIASSEPQASELDDELQSTYLNSIVRIDVSSNTPVYKNGLNICNSEGTGFLISSQHVITAEHVFNIDAACGAPIIILKSRKHKAQQLAHVVGFKDDVALLKSEEPLPKTMCALRMMARDVYASKAVRYGMPGGMPDPEPIPVRIGEKDSGFSPLVVMTPHATEAGESGAPIVYRFNVAGILRSKHQQYPAYSFMITRSKVASLINQYSVPIAGGACNPAEIEIAAAGATNAVAKITINSLLSAQSQNRIADELLSRAQDTKAAFNTINPKVASGPGFVSIQTDRQGGVILGGAEHVNPEFATIIEQQHNRNAVRNAADSVLRRVEESLWEKYVAEATRAGKWKDEQ